MNKTISINLGGFFFHIDEDAFNKLNRYLDAVKRSLSPEGRDEIIKDIESRIAELFQEKIINEKQVISSKEVEDMITIMGQPEDYKIDEEPVEKNSKNQNTYYSRKKLYRDVDEKVLGGVCAGFSHYIGVDAIWLKIVFLLLTVSGGFGIPLYLILWVLLPKAITTAQKLEMRGMPINISNIEKKVKESFDEIASKFNEIDAEKVMYNVKNGSQKVGSSIEDLFSNLFKLFGKIVGGFIVMITSITLISLLIGTIFICFSSSLDHINMPWNEYLRASNYTDFPMWIVQIFFFFVIAIPTFFFLILGLKLLISNLKSIGSYAKYSLLGLWILSIIFLVYFGLRQASEVSYESKIVEKKEISIASNDTLNIFMKYNNYYTKSIHQKTDFEFIRDEKDQEIIYSNNVKIHLMKTDENKPFIQIEKTAYGNSYEAGKERAKKIDYNYDIQGNNINLDNYLITARNNKFRDQEVHVYIYIPKGIVVYPSESISDYLTNSNSDINMYYGKENHFYKLIDGEFKCLNCPVEVTEDWESSKEDKNEIELKINGKEIISTKNESTTIKIDENGLKIETKDIK